MKKTIIIASSIGALLIFLDSANVGHGLVLLFLAGIVPGTDILISPTDMMAAIATAITVVILRITAWPTLRALLGSQVSTNIMTPAQKRTHHRVI